MPRSRPKKSPSSKACRPKAGAREIPLPPARRTDPPGLPLPTDPRTRPAWRRSFARPQPPFTADQAALCCAAAETVVNEVQAVTREARFPRQRWIDWLCRRSEAYFRTSRGLRNRFSGPHDREWLRVYQRHWLFAALLQTNFKYRRLLPPEMWGGHSPLACPPTFWTAHQRGKRKAA